MASVVSRSFFSKKFTRPALGKLPSTADILIQTDDSVNMADFKNWANDVSVLLNLNDALENENVGSTSLGTQYFNRFATATLVEAKVIPSKDWLNRNLGSIGGDDLESSQTWIRKDFIDQYRVIVSAVNQTPVDSIRSFLSARNLSGIVAMPQDNIAQPPTRLNNIILPEGAPLSYICNHEAANSGGTGATFIVNLVENTLPDQNNNLVPDGTYTVYTVELSDNGSGYEKSEDLTILGSQFNGVDGIDDININDLTLSGYNLTIEKSQLDTGLTLNDYIISTVFQNSFINFIKENDNSSEFYDIFLSSTPETEIFVGDEVLFERGDESLWNKLNRSFIPTAMNIYYGTLSRSKININVVSATSGEISYPKFTRSLKIQTTQDLSTIIPSSILKKEEFSFFAQIWSENPIAGQEGNTAWDSVIITGYNKVATKTTDEGVTYYEYYINLKYPLRISITSEYILQYAYIYKNILQSLTSSFVLESLPNKAIEVAFQSIYTYSGFNFPISKISSDDAVDQQSASTLLSVFPLNQTQNFYAWTNIDIDTINYPSLTPFYFTNLNASWYYVAKTNDPVNPTTNERMYNNLYYTNFDDLDTIRNKDRIKASMYVRPRTGDPAPGTIDRGGYEELLLNNYADISENHSGINSSTPILYWSDQPLGNNDGPQLMSDINSGATTQNIILSNLVGPVNSISWNERIGTSEPILTTTETRYWQKIFPSHDNTGTSYTIGNTTYPINHYLKIDDEIISFENYTEVGENRYELTGVVRGVLGSTAVAHDGFDSTGVVKLVTKVFDIRESVGVFDSNGELKSSFNSQFYWRINTTVTPPSYDVKNSYTIMGKISSDNNLAFRYQAPLYGPCNYLSTESYQVNVVSVNYDENSIIFDDVSSLASNMSIVLVGLDNGTGNDAKISKIDFIRNKVYLTSNGNIFDQTFPDMIGNTATFKFNLTNEGGVPYIANFKLAESIRYRYASYSTNERKIKYYLEPYPIGNRAYEDLYGTVYQAFIASRNLITGIQDDDETYFKPRRTSETFLIQASRDQFFSNESVPAQRIKYLNESIFDGTTIVLNDSSGIDVGDTIFGPGIPNEGGIIWSLEAYNENSKLVFYPGSTTYNVWFYSTLSRQIYFRTTNVGDGSDLSPGMLVSGSTLQEDTYVVSVNLSSVRYGYFYVTVNKQWTGNLAGTITFGSGYYTPAKIKVRTQRQVYSDIIIYDYSLSSFNGEPCARFKLKKTEVGNIQANISHISKLYNSYANPAYSELDTLVLYDGRDYTAPVIGFENHPTETDYYYVYANNDQLENELNIENYNTFSRGIPSELEIVNIRKISDLPSNIPVGTEYKINPIPNLNKNTRYSLDNGKVVWFSTIWNEGDIELNTYYVPDQYDSSVFWDLDKDENSRYFHVASKDQKSYTIQETSGTNFIQTNLTNSFVFPTITFAIDDVVYFTNIPASLSSFINTDTGYYIIAVNSASPSDFSISTTQNGSAISLPSLTGLNLKVRLAQALFKEFEATTSGNEVTFSNPAEGVSIGAKIYGSGITNPIFRTITDVTRNTNGDVLTAILDSNVNQPKNQPQIYNITGFNQITTQDTFTQTPENLDEDLVPTAGILVLGNQQYSYSNLVYQNNTYTFTIPTSELNEFYIKPQTKIAVKYPELTTEVSVSASDTKIEIYEPPISAKKFFKLIVYETVLEYFSYTTISEIEFYYNESVVSTTGAIVYGPGTTAETNQNSLNSLIDGNKNNAIYDFNHNTNGSTTYIIEFPEPVLVDSYNIFKGNGYYGGFPAQFELFSSDDNITYNRISTETFYTISNSLSVNIGLRTLKPEAIDKSYPEFGNIRINDEIIYYGYRTDKYFGDCIIKQNHPAGSTVKFSPYNAIKENSIIYNGSDELCNIRVVVTESYSPNPTQSQQIKVAGLEVDSPYIDIAIKEKNTTTNQYNENNIISDKIDISKKCFYVDQTTLELEAGAILTDLENGDELLIQTSYGIGPGYKVSLLKDSKSFYLNKPTINSSVSDSESSPFRKMFIVDSQILSGLNDSLVTSSSTFNSGRGFKYIPLSGCLDIKPVKCLESKYVSFPSEKYSKTLYLSDKILDSETLTGLVPKYTNGIKNSGNYVLSFEGNDYEIESIEYPDLSDVEEVVSNFILTFNHDQRQNSVAGIDIDSSGNIYATSSVLNAPSGLNNIYLMKFTSGGNKVWTKKIASDFSFDLRSENLKIYNDQIYIIAKNYGNNAFVLLKFDLNGNILLDKELTTGGTETSYGALEFDSSGNLWLGGTTLYPGVYPGDFVSSTTPDEGDNNNGHWEINLPWNINFAGTNYSTIYLNTNAVISFQYFNPVTTTSFSSTSPNVDRIFFGTSFANNSCQRIWYGTKGTAPTRTYHLIYEGTAGTSGVVGNPNINFEFVFYEDDSSRIDMNCPQTNRSTGGGANNSPYGGMFSSTHERLGSWYLYNNKSYQITLPSESNDTDMEFAYHSLYDGYYLYNSSYPNKLVLSDYLDGYSSNHVYTKTKKAYNRPFSLSFVVEILDPSNNPNSNVFGIAWTTVKNRHGDYYGLGSLQSLAYEKHRFVFSGDVWRNAYQDHAVMYMFNGSSDSSAENSQSLDRSSGGLGTVGIKQKVYYWMDYDPSTSQMKIYYSLSNTKPTSEQHTFSITFDSTELYFSIFASNYYATTFADTTLLESIDLTFTDNNEIYFSHNDFSIVENKYSILSTKSTSLSLTGNYAGGLLVELDTDFNIINDWVIGNSESQWRVHDIKFDSTGNRYICYHVYGSQIGIYKYNSANSLQWSKTIGQYETYNYAKYDPKIELDNNDNVYVSWYSYSPVNTNSPSMDYYYGAIVKFDSSGNLLWGKYFSSPSSEYLYDLEVDKNTGTTYHIGYTSGGPINSDIFIISVDTDGNLLNKKYFASSNSEIIRSGNLSPNSQLKMNGDVAYFVGLSTDSNPSYGGLLGRIDLSSPANQINGLYGDIFQGGNLPDNFVLENFPNNVNYFNYGSPSFNSTISTLSVLDGNKTVSAGEITINTYTYGSKVDLEKNYIKVNLTAPIKIASKAKDTVIVKSQDYTTSYERIPNVRGLIYGPQKAVLFDNYKSVIIDNSGNFNRTYLYIVEKTLKTTTSHSEIGDINSFVILTDVADLHADSDAFVTGNGIRLGTKIKSINYKNKVVYLTQSLSDVPSTITFFVRRYKYTRDVVNGDTNNISIGDTVSFIVSGDINTSSEKFYVSKATSSSITINGRSQIPNSNIMYIASGDGFSTRDFEIGAIELGGFKNNQRQQIVNTSVVADGTDGAIYDIETVQTRATREMFTLSLGTTLGRFIFKQRNFISKNRPIYWNTVPDQPVFDSAKVEKIISGLYQDRPFFVSYSGSKLYWSFNGETWEEKDTTKLITHISYVEVSENILISFNDGIFKSIPLNDLELSSGIDYTFVGATSIRFTKRVGSYTFIQTNDGLYYTAVDPSSSVQDTIVWNSITLGNNSQILEIVFTDYDYVIIFEEVSQTNFYKNFVLSNVTGVDLNIDVITDRIKGYNNVFTPVKTNAVTYGLGKFVESGYRLFFEGVYQSPFIEIYEYENFSDITSPESTEKFDVKALTYNDGQYLCAGLNTDTNEQFIRYSPNARVWYDVELPVDFIAADEEITAINYGGFNTYVAAVWNTTTLTNRFIISALPLPSTTNLTPEQYDVDTGRFKIIESAGNTTLYKYKSSILEGNLLAWDGSKLVYFKYESGAPVETNELNDFKIIGCQSCTYYEYNGLIVPNFRTAPEQIGIDDQGDPIFTSAPLSLYEESLINPVIIYGGEGYEASTTYDNIQVGSEYGIDARIRIITNDLGEVIQSTITNGGRFYSNLEEITSGLRVLNNTGIDPNGNINNVSEDPIDDKRAIIKFNTALNYKQFSVNSLSSGGSNGYALIYKNYLNTSLYYVMFFDENGVFLDSQTNVFISDIAHLSSEFAFGQGL